MIRLLDLLTLDDGSQVDADSWGRRRQELFEAIVPHEYGGLPSKPNQVSVTRRSRVRVRDLNVDYEVHEICVTLPTGEIRLTMSMWVPPGDEARPVLLDVDGCWRFLNDRVVERVLDRGYLPVSFDRTQAAADNKDEYRSTGLYRLYPEAEFGVISCWAWGLHRCIDALEQLPPANADQIAITGHSRGGKTVLLAGATDERIAITNPNDSGTGGGASNRWKCEGAEVVDDFFRSGNIFWFGRDFAEHRHRDGQLSYDQHYLHALVAPRGLLITEGYEDHAANPPASYLACQTVRSVYDLLDSSDQVGWALREGGHDHREIDYEALLDFMDLVFRSGEVRRDFQRPLFPQLEQQLSRL
ncbi:MAG: hypothetical protein VX733_09115 [Candidatus Latescibacterota bacterium]|nr:hypothetical protein [Candidatus Latescibacterota bacterium]